MRAVTTFAFLASLVGATQAVRIVQSNDDGWAELYARSVNAALKAKGHDVILSAPADNKSGSGSRDEEPVSRSDECQYGSCPPDSGPLGVNETSPDLHWVNSFPVTAMRYGIDDFVKQAWPEGAELAVSGINVGSNVWLQLPFSGTVGAAVFAAHERKIPALAFSGASTGTLAWDTEPVPARSSVYAELAARLVDAVVADGKPYLPEDVFLNVNFQKVNDRCAKADDFSWIFTRVNPGLFSDPDAENCGDNRLPREAAVLFRSDGCYATISVADATDKSTAPAEKQAPVFARLADFVSCLP